LQAPETHSPTEPAPLVPSFDPTPATDPPASAGSMAQGAPAAPFVPPEPIVPADVDESARAPDTARGYETIPKRRRVRWKHKKSSRLLFFDVETTGLSADDRIVSLGMVSVMVGDLHRLDQPGSSEAIQCQRLHLIFNPERASNPFAQRVHGWTDDVLARQNTFSVHSTEIAGMLADADVWLAHHMAFDLKFLKREFELLGQVLPQRRTFCTMEHARRTWKGESAKLDECCKRIGLGRAGSRHSSLEDALLCTALYAHFNTGWTFNAFPECGLPTNLVREDASP